MANTKSIRNFENMQRNITNNVSKFNEELSMLSIAIEEEFDNIVENVVSEFFETLVSRTPIKTGNARINWNINTTGFTGEVIPYPEDKTPIQDRIFYKRSLKTKIRGYRSGGYDFTGKRIPGLFASAKSASLRGITRVKIVNFRNSFKTRNSKSIYIFNNAKHINSLEYGTSNQAPNGMLSVTIQDFSRLINKHSQGSKIFR